MPASRQATLQLLESVDNMFAQEESETLDSIRGMAAIVVLLMHVKQWFVCPLIGWDHPSVRVTSHVAHFAVLAFFALSGYVVTHSLLNNCRRHGGRVDAFIYVRARLARIVPPALAACVFSLLVWALIVGGQLHGAESFRTERDKWVERESVSLRAKDVGATFLMSNGIIPGTKAISINAPMWSLSLEFWAYFFALIAAGAVCGRRSCHPAGRSDGLIQLIALTLLTLLLASRPLAVFQYFFYWLIGSLLLLRKERPQTVNLILAAIVLGGCLAALRCATLETNWSLLFENGAAGVWGVPIKGGLLVALASTAPLIRRLPSRRVFARVSRSSYTLYLFHYPMLCLAFSLFHLDYLDWGFGSRAIFVLCLTGGILVACHLLATPLEDKRAWTGRFDRLWSRWN